MEHQLDINDDRDIVVARVLAREMAAAIGFSTMDQSRIATAVSELTRNVLRYATNGRGLVTLRTIDEAKQGIEIEVRDYGPGIADVEVAMRRGYSSGRGLGLGLSGTKRLMDEMHLVSELGLGTTVTVRKWLR